jgi:uncharacterized membrane protein YeaQ/YmgE (transglycosylase-associated protein family)
MATLDGNYIDPSNVSARQTGIRWGLILGLISSAVGLIMYFTGLTDYSSSSWLTFFAGIIPIILCIYYAQVQHRDTELGGYMTLGRGVSVALWVGLIAGLIGMVFSFFLFSFVIKDFAEMIMTKGIENAEAKGQDPEQVRKGMEMMKWMFNPPVMSVFALIGNLFWAVIVGLLVGLVTKKDSPKPY